MPDLLRSLHDDVTLQGAAMPLISHLVTVSRAASPDFVDLAVLYLSARLRMRTFPVLGRPRKLPSSEPYKARLLVKRCSGEERRVDLVYSLERSKW
jgi:hypothetical protein